MDDDTDGGPKIVLVESGGDADRQTLNICGTFSARTNLVCFDLGIKVFKVADVSQRLRRQL